MIAAERSPGSPGEDVTEMRAILGNRHSNLWPEPLDLLEIENTRDGFAFSDETARTGEPIVVYTRPPGLPESGEILVQRDGRLAKVSRRARLTLMIPGAPSYSLG